MATRNSLTFYRVLRRILATVICIPFIAFPVLIAIFQDSWSGSVVGLLIGVAFGALISCAVDSLACAASLGISYAIVFGSFFNICSLEITAKSVYSVCLLAVVFFLLNGFCLALDPSFKRTTDSEASCAVKSMKMSKYHCLWPVFFLSLLVFLATDPFRVTRILGEDHVTVVFVFITMWLFLSTFVCACFAFRWFHGVVKGVLEMLDYVNKVWRLYRAPVFGFIGLYTLSVFLFACYYKMLYSWNCMSAFNFPGRNSGARMEFSDFLYFSFVTITTLGYGDIEPTNGLTRLVASVEVIFGVALVVLYIGFMFKYIGEQRGN